MEHREFKIGGYFYCGGHKWLCTDVGTRTIAALQITPEIEQKPNWLSGPPYAVPEILFDENDLEACGKTPEHDERASEHRRHSSPPPTL